MIVLNEVIFDSELAETSSMVRFKEKSALIEKYFGSQFKHARQRGGNAFYHVLASTVFVSIDRPKTIARKLRENLRHRVRPRRKAYAPVRVTASSELLRFS